MKILFASLFLFVIASCAPVRQIPSAPPIDFDSNYLNNQIKLFYVKEMSPLNTSDSIALLLEYDSTNKIVLPSNFNIRIFIQEDGKWLELLDNGSYPQGPIVLSLGDPSSFNQIVGFWPLWPNPDHTYYVRVYVFGDMETLDGTEKVGAFLDLVVAP